MGKFPLSATPITSVPGSLQLWIAASREHLLGIFRWLLQSTEDATSAVQSFSTSSSGKIAAWSNALNEPRRSKTPRLQFASSSYVAASNIELDEMAIIASRRNRVVQQASQLEKLHARAGRTLDAADYALLRMRLELAEIAPALVTELLVERSHVPEASRGALLFSRGTVPDHHDIAA